MRDKRLVKSVASVIIPLLLFTLLIFQLYRCKNILSLRNSYLLESLPYRSDWVWDALSGNIDSQAFVNDVRRHAAETANLGDTGHLVVDSKNIRESERPVDHAVSSKLSQDSSSRQNDHKAVLFRGIPSLTVHYLWCIDGHFELSHYLVILSVIHQLQPDKIVIHYRTKPRPDPQGYWRWLEDVQRDIVMLSMRPLSNPRHCSHDLSAGVSHDSHDFPDPYGVFLLGEVAVSNLTRTDIVQLMMNSFASHMHSNPDEHVISASDEDLRKSQVFLIADTEPYHMSQDAGRVVISCPSVTAVNNQKKSDGIKCININTYINPDELFVRDTRFFRFARNIMYGSPDAVAVKMAPSEQIPNIVHIIMIDWNGEVTPLLYVSIKSAFIRGGAKDVLIHGPKSPSGPLWERLHTKDDLKVRYIPTATREEYGIRHAGMTYALYTLLQYGGVAHFGDVIFIQPIPSSSRHASAIVTLHYSQYRLKHRSTNTAILAGAKGSEFIKSMLARIRQKDPLWDNARADDIATHVAETIPFSVLLDSKLTSQQRCNNQRCRVEGGHVNPQQAYTTRIIWEGEQPQSVEQLRDLEGPARQDMKEVIEGIMPEHQNI